jgi:hypothetical protein
MTSLNLNIEDAAIEALTGPELKAHISAIQGFEQKKISDRKAGMTMLRRLRQWSKNEDGLLGIPKGTNPQVRSMEELKAKAAARAKTLSELPKSNEKVTPFDPLWDDPADQIDGVNESAQDSEIPVTVATGDAEREQVMAAIQSHNDERSADDKAFDNPHHGHHEAEDDGAEVSADDDDGDAPAIPPAPAPNMVVTAAGVEVKVDGETITHKRGTLRARLATQAANAKPIELAPSAQRDRRPKKETGAPRKAREVLLGVKATFRGLTKNHEKSMRKNVLVYVQTKATRPLPGWPTGAVPIGEIEKFFAAENQPVKPFLHKLIEDGHLERVTPDAM